MTVYARIRNQITTVPSYPNGLKIGAYLFPTSDGSSGQALITNGSGTVSWGNAGAQLSGTNTWTGTQTFSNATYSALFTGGNVGIGTSSPGALLHVTGAASQSGTFRISSNGQSTNNFDFGQGWATGTDNIAWIYNRANADLIIATNNTERMRITSSGNVGIGTGSPSATLNVVAPNTSAIEARFTGGNTQGLAIQNSTLWEYRVAADTGEVAFNYIGYNDGTTYFRNTTIYSGKYGLVARFQGSTGYLGIGTGSPSAKLHVADGNFLISKSSFGGNLQWTQGSTSPQSGVFTWGDGTGWRMDFGTSSSNKLSIYDNATTSVEISDRFYVKNQPIYLYNNVGGIQQTDSGGTARWMMRFDTSNQRIFGDTSAGSGNSTYIQSNSAVYLQSGTTPGQAYLNSGGDFVTGREFITNNANGLRIGTLMLRNDGSNSYFLFGTSGTAGDNWNSLRPFFINNTSGWVAIGNASSTHSSLTVGGSVAFAASSISANTTLDGTYTHVFASGTITITLPTAVGISGRTYWIKRTGTGTITINTTSSQTIDGAASLSITAQYDSYTLVSDGSNWFIM